MADNWDEDDFEPGEFQDKKGDKWEGEDEDDDGLKENWDDEDVEEDKEKTESKQSSSGSGSTGTNVTKKKSVKQRILEREEQKKEEMLRKAKLKKDMEENEDDEDDEESIFKSELAEKLRKQKLVEEADLEVAMDTFGISTVPDDGKKSIDSFKPTNREEFNELAKMIVEKLSQFETSVEYPGFLEVLVRDLATGIEADEVKKLGSALNVLASEKQKAQKVGKGKKKPKKAVLGGGAKGLKGVDLQDYSTYGDEYDDFI